MCVPATFTLMQNHTMLPRLAGYPGKAQLHRRQIQSSTLALIRAGSTKGCHHRHNNPSSIVETPRQAQPSLPLSVPRELEPALGSFSLSSPHCSPSFCYSSRNALGSLLSTIAAISADSVLIFGHGEFKGTERLEFKEDQAIPQGRSWL